LISNWAIDEDNPTSSDHELIRFDISSTENTMLEAPPNERWNWKKANWDNFGKHLKEQSDSTSDIWKALHHHNNQANLKQRSKVPNGTHPRSGRNQHSQSKTLPTFKTLVE
jgi:hypothetical protein